jgi:Cdc6-like AAA superfamily ATPase
VLTEAYAWDPGPGSTNDGSASYKAEAIEALMTMDEQLNSDTAIILAGYKEKMDAFFKNGNIGLKRRFDYEQAIIFEDYDDEELHQILSKMLNDEQLAMEESDKAAVIAMISKQRKQLLFGNAGEVENAIGNC